MTPVTALFISMAPALTGPAFHTLMICMTVNRTIYIRNLVKTSREIGLAIHSWAEHSSSSRRPPLSDPVVMDIHRKIQSAREKTASILEQNHASAANLPIPSRRAYQWLVFLTDRKTFTAHLETLLELVRLWNNSPSSRFDTIMTLFHTGDFYRIRQRKNSIDLTAHESFIAAETDVLQALVTIISRPGHRPSKRILKRFSSSEEHFSIRQELEGIEIIPDVLTRGKYHDLGEIFQRVNRDYFQNSLPRPLLTWNQQLTYRKFGHYQFSSDVLMISRSLDQPHIPVFVLDFVMYHELLHKKMGFQLVNGRRYAHTAQFKKNERRFEKWEEAQRYLRDLSRQLAG